MLARGRPINDCQRRWFSGPSLRWLAATAPPLHGSADPIDARQRPGYAGPKERSCVTGSGKTELSYLRARQAAFRRGVTDLYGAGSPAGYEEPTGAIG